MIYNIQNGKRSLIEIVFFLIFKHMHALAVGSADRYRCILAIYANYKAPDTQGTNQNVTAPISKGVLLYI